MLLYQAPERVNLPVLSVSFLLLDFNSRRPEEFALKVFELIAGKLVLQPIGQVCGIKGKTGNKSLGGISVGIACCALGHPGRAIKQGAGPTSFDVHDELQLVSSDATV